MSLFASAQLEALEAEGLLRKLVIKPGPPEVFADFASNDYLALANDPRLAEAAVQAITDYGCSSGASALMSGRLPLHEELEMTLARFTGREDSLVFGSGFLTNLGTLGALCDRQDNIFTDKLNHASLIDGARLSRAKVLRYRHNDPEHLESSIRNAPAKGKRIIVSESVFSMDGDIAPLEELLSIAKRYDALLVIDEAHALGVFGGGLMNDIGKGDEQIVILGTLSKALGSYGGFVACTGAIKKLIINRARTFIYSTALPPANAAAALRAVEILETERERGREVLDRAELFSNLLGRRGAGSSSQIVPFIVGENRQALALSEKLKLRSIFAPAIRPPTVPAGTARLRFSVTYAHTPAVLYDTAQTLLALENDG